MACTPRIYFSPSAVIIVGTCKGFFERTYISFFEGDKDIVYKLKN